MAHIPINRVLNVKQARRQHRKRRIEISQRARLMFDAFAQLSIVDASRIRRRAEREISRHDADSCQVPILARQLNVFSLSYKYTYELLETVVV